MFSQCLSAARMHWCAYQKTTNRTDKTVNSDKYPDALFALTLMLKPSMRLPANMFLGRKEIS
jgi:hypothetical protein